MTGLTRDEEKTGSYSCSPLLSQSVQRPMSINIWKALTNLDLLLTRGELILPQHSAAHVAALASGTASIRSDIACIDKCAIDILAINVELDGQR